MDNCPPLNQLNCRNFEIRCYDCICNDSAKSSFNYVPMDKSIIHPYKAEERKDRSTKGRVNNRKGRVNEKIIMNKIHKGQANKSSIGNDGVIKLDTLLQVEIKTRLRGTPKWPTKKEWDKFLSKGLDIFIVDSGDGDIRCSMSLHTLNSLIENQL